MALDNETGLCQKYRIIPNFLAVRERTWWPKMANRRSLLSSSLEPLPSSTVDPLRELFEACKTGDIARVKKLVTPQTVNARDTAGRKSTPLHFAAGEFGGGMFWSVR